MNEYAPSVYEQQYQQTDLDDFFSVADKQLENPQIYALSTPSVHHI